VEIGQGIFLPRTRMNTILTVSDTPSKLARNLMQALYNDNELIDRTLFGFKCNANKDRVIKPSIETSRRDAIIGILFLYQQVVCVKCFSIDPDFKENVYYL